MGKFRASLQAREGKFRTKEETFVEITHSQACYLSHSTNQLPEHLHVCVPAHMPVICTNWN